MRAVCGSPPEKPAGLSGSPGMSLRQAGIPLGLRGRRTLGEDPARENLCSIPRDRQGFPDANRESPCGGKRDVNCGTSEGLKVFWGGAPTSWFEKPA